MESTAARGTCVCLYTRNDDLPHKPRRLTFRNKSSDFSITISYDDEAASNLPEGECRYLGKYTIKMPERPAGSPPSDVRITWNLDKNGLIYVQSAQLLEEVLPGSEEATNGESKGEGKEGEEKGSETPAEAPKKRFKKNDLQFTTELPGLTKEEVKNAMELEASMAFEDKLITETADKRNELESYIYSMRDKLDGPLKDYVLPADKDSFKNLIMEAEDWLYGDGFDSTKQEYGRRIDSLRAISDPIERRVTEAANRPQAIEGLKKQLEMCKTFTSKYSEDTTHITEEERDKLRKAASDTEDWMYDTISKQGELPLHADPILSTESIAAKRNDLFKISNPIMTKPKPAPKPAESSTNPPPAPQDAKAQDGDNKDASNDSKMDTEESEQKGKDSAEDGAAKAEPMEQCKGGPDEGNENK